eukprot:6203600-Pleurochrysis_carterae.AAC.2
MSVKCRICKKLKLSCDFTRRQLEQAGDRACRVCEGSSLSCARCRSDKLLHCFPKNERSKIPGEATCLECERRREQRLMCCSCGPKPKSNFPKKERGRKPHLRKCMSCIAKELQAGAVMKVARRKDGSERAHLKRKARRLSRRCVTNTQNEVAPTPPLQLKLHFAHYKFKWIDFGKSGSLRCSYRQAHRLATFLGNVSESLFDPVELRKP